MNMQFSIFSFVVKESSEFLTAAKILRTLRFFAKKIYSRSRRASGACTKTPKVEKSQYKTYNDNNIAIYCIEAMIFEIFTLCAFLK